MEDKVHDSLKQELSQHIESLLYTWCDRRCLTALRYLLQAWPISPGLTDDWGSLSMSLKDVRAFARDEITPFEMEQLERLIRAVDAITYRES